MNPEIPAEEPKPFRVVLPKRSLAKLKVSERRDFDLMEEEGRLDNPVKYESRKHSLEMANPKAKYIDFFQMSDKQKASFKEGAARFNQSVRVFVHPYYYVDNLFGQDELDVQDKNDLIPQRLLAKNRDQRPPVIIMEDYTRIPTLFDMIKGFNQDDVYIVPTFSGTSQPYPDDDAICVPRNESFQGENWKILTDELKDAEIENVIVGGIVLRKAMGNEKEAGFSYGGCVGYAINNLEQDFNVSISNAT